MENGVMIEATIGMVSMAAGLVGVFINAEKKIALNRQEINFLKEQHAKLEIRVSELENNIYERLDMILEKIQLIEIKIAKL